MEISKASNAYIPESQSIISKAFFLIYRKKAITVVKLEWKLRKFNRCKRIEMKTALIAFSAILYFPSATGLANMDKTQLFCLNLKSLILQLPIANL